MTVHLKSINSSFLKNLGITILIIFSFCAALLAQASNPQDVLKGQWLDKSLSPDERAVLVAAQLTYAEKLRLLHGVEGPRALEGSIGGIGYVPGVPRLGIPDLQYADGRSGVSNAGAHGRYATALPSALADGATWDLDIAYQYGALLGREIRDLGFQVSLGGTANIIREPRNGRNFECLGEDPVLVGKMVAQVMKGTESPQVIGNLNRYAVNDQETGRTIANSVIDRRAMHESDLLAFEIALKESNVGTVMCAYTLVNGVYPCQDPYLLTDVLKNSWGFKGWVMTDWYGAHSTVASALAGLDQEMPNDRFFGTPLRSEVGKGNVPVSRVNDMVHRILRTEFALGVIDNPPSPHPVNPFTGAELAQRIEEQAIVLLKNSGSLLPLNGDTVKSIAVIGGHADVGVLSGGGSDQIDAPGGNAVPGAKIVWQPSSPLKATRLHAPNARIEYDAGTDLDSAAKLAANSDVAIVFAYQHAGENADLANLTLPDRQDELVSRVAMANPHSIVVLETGGPVLMPWVEKAGAILETWYPGIRGGEAIANVLFGAVNPSGKLPVTFPKSEADLPRPIIAGMTAETARAGGEVGNTWWAEGMKQLKSFDINYSEGAKVGYKWFESEGKQPLFPFGLGFSYTTFLYAGLEASSADGLKVSFRVTNGGARAGAEVAQVYIQLPPSSGENYKRLAAWKKVSLVPGASQSLTLVLDPKFLSIFNVRKNAWELLPGEYRVYVGGSSRDLKQSQSLTIPDTH